uniref:Uncharacterized protein n=1 Tax=Arundo donax TaxID=35708 RepID=A0A0A8Z1B7_ARUDO
MTWRKLWTCLLEQFDEGADFIFFRRD